MSLSLHRALLAAAVIAVVASSHRAEAVPQAKLWIAFEGGDASLKPTLDGTNVCLLQQTNFNALLAGWSGGETLTLGGPSKVLTSSCSDFDWQCVVDQTGWPVGNNDVVGYIRSTQTCGGGENHHNVNITVGGQTRNIRGFVVWATKDTCASWFMTHEMYEAATPTPSSADCCNGQNAQNQFGAGCYQKFGPNGSIAVDGYTTIACANGTFGSQYLSPAGQENNVNACVKLTVGPSCGAQVDQPCATTSDCCQSEGLVCKFWSYSGQPPFQTNCCKPVGGDCSVGTDCCGGSSCDGGKCSCVPAGGWCINVDECCAGYTCDTTANKCVAGSPATTSSTASVSSSDATSASSSDASTTSSGAGGAGSGGGSSGPPPKSGCRCDVAGASGGEVAFTSAAVLGLAMSMRRRLRRGLSPFSRPSRSARSNYAAKRT